MDNRAASRAWEPNELVAKRKFPASFKPHHLKENLAYAQALGVTTIFFWGYEYWLKQKLEGLPEYWKKAEELKEELLWGD